MRKAFIIILLMTCFNIVSQPVYALSPGPAIMECAKNKNARPDCKKILCQFENANRNWPKDKGIYEDCTTGIMYNKNVVFIGIVGSLIAFISVIAFYLIRRFQKTNTKAS